MKSVKLKLDSIDRIKKFNNTVSRFDCDFDLEQGRFYVDGKSLMGLLSLDLNAPIDLHFYADEKQEDAIMNSLEDFIIS